MANERGTFTFTGFEAHMVQELVLAEAKRVMTDLEQAIKVQDFRDARSLLKGLEALSGVQKTLKFGIEDQELILKADES